jgi:hypothetical protein
MGLRLGKPFLNVFVLEKKFLKDLKLRQKKISFTQMRLYKEQNQVCSFGSTVGKTILNVLYRKMFKRFLNKNPKARNVEIYIKSFSCDAEHDN